jgi:hypothetical protein
MENGKKVKVKEDLVVDQFYGGKRFHNGMSKYLGKETTVAEKTHYGNNTYHIWVDLEGYDWTPEMLEVIGE